MSGLKSTLVTAVLAAVVGATAAWGAMTWSGPKPQTFMERYKPDAYLD